MPGDRPAGGVSDRVEHTFRTPGRSGACGLSGDRDRGVALRLRPLGADVGDRAVGRTCPVQAQMANSVRAELGVARWVRTAGRRVVQNYLAA